MITNETETLDQYQANEQAWLTAHVADGIFDQNYLDLLKLVHNQMTDRPRDYLLGVARFTKQVLGEGATGDKLGPDARLLTPKIYVARLVASVPNRGVGLNIVFGPTDPSHHEIASELYPRTLHKMGIDEHVIPYSVLTADAYYFQGSAYNQGKIEGDVIDSGYKVFNDWEQTWAYLHTDRAVFFRLGGPFIHPNSREILAGESATRTSISPA